jgi:hypothetical protein
MGSAGRAVRSFAMRLLALPLALLGAAAIAAEDVGPYSFTLSGKAFDERCLNLAVGESIRYRFRASAPIDFNIHYHRGNKTSFPVKRLAVRDIESTFKAPRADGYCLMWQHRGEGVAKVEGSIERVPPR